MFVERKVCYSALFTNLVAWHAGTVSFPLSDVILAQLACPLSDVILVQLACPLSDVILAQLACPLSDVMFCLFSGITNLSLYKH